MEDTLSFKSVLDLMANNYGLAGIFAPNGFGQTVLMMQIIGEINNRKDGVALVMANEMGRQHWQVQMQRINLSTDRVLIDGEPLVTYSRIHNYLQQFHAESKKVSVICIEYLELMDRESIRHLNELAEKFNVLILVNGLLTRDAGDYDPELRPDMYSIGVFRNKLHGEGNQALAYNFLVLLHRKHKCDRGIGFVRRYDVQNETELIVKRSWDRNLGSVFIKWNDKELKFEL